MPDRLFFVTAVAASLALSSPADVGQQVIRTRIDTVHLDVTVLNRSGVFEAGLGPDDFEVLDNGRPQPLTSFSSDHSPITVALVLDMSDSMIRYTRRLGEAAEAFIGALQSGDRAAVGSLTESGPLRTDAAALRQDLSYLTLGEPSLIWRGIERTAAALVGAEGRRALLISTDGKDNEDNLRELAPGGRASGVIERWFSSSYSAGEALKSRVVQLYVVAPNGARLTSPLRKLAEDSGGRALAAGRDAKLPEMFEAIIDELHRQYVLGYAQPEADGRVHEIEVRTKPRGLVVRTRRSYVAGSR
jgi:Ca-activated chloride channel family protein